MRSFLVLGFLALIIQYDCLPVDILSDLSWSGDSSLAEALSRVKKDVDVLYLEECTFVQSWQEQPGFINVLAFLDASWEYSHRQAIMLKMLQGRLERSGITDIRFFVINSAEPEATVNNVDIEDERQAWGAAESIHDQAFSEIEQTREALKDKIGPDIAFVQDSDKLRIWEKLSASRDQVLVIDKCGKLSYRVIVPWSILRFPYVKAAILSTYKEQPCGGCNLETTTVAYVKESQTEEPSEMLPENFNIKHMKEIAIKTYNLDESDNTVKKVYSGAASHDIPDNVIQLLNGSAGAKQEETTTNLKFITNHELLRTTGDPNFDDIYVNNDYQTLNGTDYNYRDNEYENLSVTTDTSNIDEHTESQNNDDSSATINNQSRDSVESTTIYSIEDDSFNDHYNDDEKCDYPGNRHEVDNSESTESTDLKNNLKTEGKIENLNTISYSVEANDFGNGYINDTNSDTEVSNNSTPLIDEQTDNHINRMASGENTAEQHSESFDYVVPIRIIMHAPHTHGHDKSRKKYEYLVLKLGDPDFHGHLEYDDDLVSNDHEASSESKNDSGIEYKADEENNGGELGSGELSITDNYNHRHRDSHHGHKGGHKKGKSQHMDLVYDKNETPGFYGEDADYWRNSAIIDEERFKIGQTVEKISYIMDEIQMEGYETVNITDTDENNSTTVKTIENDTITEENTPRYENFQSNAEQAVLSEEIVQGKEFIVHEQVDQNHTNEEERANHLFEHYSKLIPWLDYVID